MAAFDYEKEKKEILEDLANPPSQCQCLNPRVVYQAREALRTASDDLIKEVQKLDKAMKNALEAKAVKEKIEGLEFLREKAVVEMIEAEAVLHIINEMPVCREEVKTGTEIKANVLPGEKVRS